MRVENLKRYYRSHSQTLRFALISAISITFLANAACEETILGVPTSELIVSASRLDFGDIGVKEHSSKFIEISAAPGAAVIVSSIDVTPASAPFTVSLRQAALPSGASVILEVAFNPQAVQNFAANLVIASDADNADSISVRLIGRGVIAGEEPISVTPRQVNLTEGFTATVAVSLSGVPRSDLSVAVTSSNTASLTVAPAVVIFTAQNWQTPQIITLSAPQEPNVYNERVSIQFTTNEWPTVEVLAIIDDDDPAVINVSNTRFQLAEGAEQEVQVSLAFEPQGALTVEISSDVPGSISTIPSQVTFTADNYDSPQTVKVVGLQEENTVNETVQLTFSSVDADPTVATIFVADDDVQAIIVSPPSLNVPEGMSQTMTVRLAYQPAQNVNVGLTASDPIAVSLMPANLTFTAMDYDVPQEITVGAIDDLNAFEDSHVITVFAPSLPDVQVNLTVPDNDTQAIIADRSSLNVVEGRIEPVAIRLAFQPLSDITLTILASDVLIADVQPTSFTFTSTNYATPQTLNISGIHDVNLEDENVSITLQSPGLSDVPILVTVIDDDQQEVISSTTSVSLTESSSTTITVWLAHQPSATVQVLPVSGAPGQLSSQPAFLTFTPTDYNVPQTLSLLALDDLDAENVATILTLTSPGVGDRVVQVAIQDDDVQAIVINPSNLSFPEGENRSFAVRLAYRPPADTVVSIQSQDSARVSTSTATLIFTSNNFASFQTIVVHALDDADLENQAVNIVISSANMADVNLTVQIADDDTQVFVASPIPLLVNEGAMGAIAVQLAYQPSSDVSVSVSVSNSSLGSLSPTSLTFTSTNYNTAQSITLLTTHDQDTDDITGTLTLTASQIANLSIPVTVADDDSQGIVVGANNLNISEGGSGNFDVSLSFMPTAEVRVFVLSPDAIIATVFPVSLTFNAANYATPQAVSVSAIQDLDLENENTIITLTAAGLPDVNVNVTVSDDDLQTILATPGSLSLREGDSRPINISLAFIPSANVTISAQVSSPSAASLSPASLVFSPSNYAGPQTLTLSSLDDLDAEDNSITLTLSSSGVSDRNITVQIEDDDVQAIIADQLRLTTNEGGSSNLSLRLAYQPTSDVNISVSPSNSNAISTTPNVLTFTPSNYLVSQTVAVAGLSDLDTQDEAVFITLAHNSVADLVVPVDVIDDDQQVINVDRTNVTVAEGATEVVNVTLAYQPAADQRVFVTTNNPGFATGAPSILVFSPTNYSVSQSVIISGVEDLNTSDEVAGLSLSSPGVTDRTINITVIDNDQQDIILDRSTVNISEGSSQTVAVRLAFQPDADTTITVSSANSSSLGTTPISMVFSPGNYSTPQTLTLNALQDLNAASETVSVNLSGGGVTALINANLQDDDQQALLLDQQSMSLLEGSTRTLTVRLAFQPVSDVTVSAASSDSLISTVNLNSLVFTPSNYATPQALSVTATEDLNTSNDSNSILLTAAGLVDGILTVDVTDNDQQAILATPTALNLGENSSLTFAVRLAYMPSNGVTVALASSDASAITLSTASLTFTPGNFANTQLVTVTGTNDDDTNDESGNITLSTAGVPDALVSFTVVDDDRQSIIVDSTVLNLNEGDTGTLLVRLAFAPLSDVTVQAVISDSSIATLAPAILTFTAANYQTNQPITIVTASDNDIADEAAIITLLSAGLSDINISLDIADDDYQTVVLRPRTLSINENASESLEVSLMFQPLNNVTVSMGSSDPSKASLNASLLTFTPANYATAQSVIVSAIDDADINDEVVQLSFDSAGINSATATVTVVDDDALNLRLNTTNVNVTEAGASANFTVALTQQPGQAINVSLFSSDTGAASMSPATLQFDDSNWSVVQTVAVLAIDDTDTANETVTVSLTSPGLATRTVNVNVLDDDIQSYILSQNTLSMNEGTSQNIDLRLAFDPLGDHTVQITSNDPGALGLGATSITFNSSNYNSNQSVSLSAIHDIDLRNEQITINFRGPGPIQETLTVTIIDDDTQSLIVSPSNTSMVEGGADSLSIRLAFAPASTTTVSISNNSPTDLSISAQTLFFTPSNFAAPQLITLLALQDLDADDENVTLSVSQNASAVATANISITDDDVQAVLVDRTSITVLEGNSSALSIQLAYRPSIDLRVFASLVDPTAANVIPATLTFTAANYDVPQTVVISGIEDLDTANDLTQLVLSSAGLADVNIPVTVTDNDALLIIADRNRITLAEGGSESLGLRLSAMPIGNVTVNIATNNANATALFPQQLTFTPSDYDQSQTVIISGIEDANASNEAVTLSISAAGLPDSSVTVDVIDNDVQLILVSPTTLTINEGASASLSVSMAFQPTANVIVNLSSLNPTALTFSTSVLSFSPANYNTAQIVVVTGVNDPDGVNVNTIIRLSSPGIPAVLVDATVIDDDVQAIVVDPGNLSLDEGTTSDLLVRLQFQPISDLTVSVTSLDPSIASPNAAQVTFTPTNYQTNQIVRVLAVSDPDTADENTDLRFSAANTADVLVNVSVNDTSQPAMLAWPSSISVNENGSASLSVSLNYQPANDTIVSISSANASAASVNISTLVFTPTNYAMPQDVIINAADDADSNDESTSLSLTAAGTPTLTIPITVVDDDRSNILVNPSRLLLNEGGSSESLSIRLATAPTADISLTIFSSDTSAAVASSSTLLFTNSNWNTAQTISVLPVSDSDTQNEQVLLTVTGPAMASRVVSIRVIDDDQQNLVLSANSLNVTEGQSDSFRVNLQFDPLGTVRVQLNSSDSGAALQTPAELFFNSSNYQTPQTVNITGIEDQDLADELVDISVNTTGANPSIVQVSVVDNDSQNIVAAPATIAMTEGGRDSVAIRLAYIPNGPTTVQLSLSNIAAASLDQTQLSFTPANHAIGQLVRVTALQDSDDADESLQISLTEPNSPTISVNLLITDDDVQSFIPSLTRVTLVEGQVSNISLRLAYQPSSDISVTLPIANGSVAASTPTSMLFTPSNYATPQTIAISALQDNDAANALTTMTVSSPVVDNVDIAIEIADDDVQAIVMADNSLALNEGGSISTTVRLAFAPLTTLSVNLVSADPSAASLSPATLTFDASNYNTPQTITVNAPHDADTNNETTQVVASSAGLVPQLVSVTVTDDDEQALILSTNTLNLSEGSSSNIDVALAFQPNADVLVLINSSDLGAAQSSLSALVFTPSNYQTAQVISVSALHDDDTNDENVTFAFSSQGLNTQDVSVAINDDDSQALVVNPQSLSINERASVVVSVALAFAPPTDLTVSINSADSNIAQLGTNTLVFTPTNFSTPQVVSVLAVEDANTSNDATTITLSASGVSDVVVSVSVIDDDVLNIRATPTNFTLQEGGNNGSINVNLTQQPLSDITLSLASSDPGAASLDVSSLVFTTSNWNVTQTVQLSPVDDNDTLDEAITIQISASGVSTRTINVSITDDDTQAILVDQQTINMNEGTSTQLQVSLAFNPINAATVTIISSDGGAASVNPITLNFDASNFATPQTVTITAPQDDDVFDENPVVTLASTSVPADQQVSITVNDDDTQAIIVSTNSIVLNEGESTLLAVQLAFNPVNNTSVTLVSAHLSVSLSATSLNFDSANYSSSQNITVTAIHDLDVLDVLSQIQLSSPSIGQNSIVSVTVNDDDTQAIIVSDNSLALNEGESRNITVRLAFDPVSASLVSLQSSDTSAVNIDLSSLAFDSSNYTQPQTVLVTALEDDDTQDEAASITLSSTIASSVAMNLTVTDDDTQQLILSPVSLSLSEGNSDIFTARLAFDPLASVTVSLNSSDAGAATLDVSQIQFDSNNYDQAQTITISALHDDDTIDESITVTGSSTVAANASVVVDISDDDTQAIVLSAQSIDVSEGQTADVTVRMQFAPVADVVVSIVSANSNAVTVSPSVMTFTAANYASPQTFTLSGQHDNDVRDLVTSITLSSAAAPANQVLAVTVIDDDVQAIIVSSNSLTVDEGADAFVSVRLAFDPIDSATVAVASSNALAVSLNNTQFFFNASNYNNPQTLVITGITDNDVLDTSTQLTLSSAAASQDVNIDVSVNDDDVQSIIVSPVSLTMGESAISAFTVRLSFDPLAATTVSITGSDDGAAFVDLSTLAFDSVNYDQAQTVQVSAPSDNDTADEVVSFTLSGGGSSNNSSLIVNVSDDDTQEIIITLTSTNAIDEGASMNFTVSLRYDPVNAVQVNAAVSDVAAAGLSAAQISFTSQNYLSAQTLTVTALQDLNASDETVTITLSGGGAATAASFVINIIDDEEQNIVLSTYSATVAEGSSGSVDVNLAFAPSADITVTVSSSDNNVVSPGTNSLNFTTANWNVPQTLSFSLGEDNDVEDTSASLTFASVDINEDSILNLTISDNDEQAIVVDTNFVQLYEISSASVNVSLAFQPTSTITVSISSDDPLIASITPSIMTFTASDFSVPRLLLIQGVGDSNTTDDTTTLRFTEATIPIIPTVSVLVSDVDGIRMVSEEPSPTNGLASLARSLQPSIAVTSGGDVTIAWHDIAPSFGGGNDYDVILRDFAFGVSPGATVLVSDHSSDGSSQRTRIAADMGNTIHIVWQDDGAIVDSGFEEDIIYRSYSAGSLDPTYILVSSGAGTGDSTYPDVAVDSFGIAHVVWQDDGDLANDGFPDNDIYYARGTIGGGFSAPIVVNSDDFSDGDSVRPRIEVAPDGCPQVIWQDDGDIDATDQDGKDDVYFRSSSLNMGGSCDWAATMLISTEADFGSTYSPRLAVDALSWPTTMWAAWHANGDVLSSGTDHDVFARTITGTTTGILNLLSDDINDNASQFASITVDGNTNVHVYWQESGDVNSCGTDYDIFGRTWNGGSWGAITSVSDPDANIFNTEISRDTDVISNQSIRYIVWDDASDYDGDGIADSDIMYEILR